MTSQAREEVFNRMVNDAIIGVKFSTSMIMQGAAEMLVYGTAVKLS